MCYVTQPSMHLAGVGVGGRDAMKMVVRFIGYLIHTLVMCLCCLCYEHHTAPLGLCILSILYLLFLRKLSEHLVTRPSCLCTVG